MTAANRQSPKGRRVSDGPFDRDLEDLPPELRWREWMGRVEAALFASATPLGGDDLKPLVGPAVSLDLLIADIRADLEGRPYEIVDVAGAWMFRTRTRFADAICAVARPTTLELNANELGVLCAIAYHQPIDRAQLADIFGKEISRDLLARLRALNLVARGPRSPKPGAPHTFVTTKQFLATFDLESLRDLPDLQLED